MSLDAQFAAALRQRPKGTVTHEVMRERQLGAISLQLNNVISAIEHLLETANQSQIKDHPLAQVIITKTEDILRPFVCITANLPNETLIDKDKEPEEHF